jgi:hypothetical protein
MHRATGWGGAPEWREGYHAAVVAVAAAAAMAGWLLVRRRATPAAAHAGVLTTWAAIATAVTVLAPGASYLLAWPLLFAAAAALLSTFDHARAGSSGAVRSAGAVLNGVAAVVAAVILVPVIYRLGTALGIALPGAIAASALAACLVAMIAPSLEWLAGDRRWMLPGLPALAAVALLVHGAATVRPGTAFPTRASLTHEVDAGDDAAALPRAVLLRDSVAGDQRAVTVRVLVPDSARLVRIATDAPVRAATVAGRAVDRSGLRRPTRAWSLGYAAPPDTGIVLELLVATPGPPRLELTAHMPGVPDSVRARANRAPSAVPSQGGDVTLVRWTGVPAPPR